MAAPPGERWRRPGRRPGRCRPAAAALPVPSVLGRLTGTSYSDVGITGITPIPGLFRYLLLCARDGPVAWDDALSRLSLAGIIRCVSCAHEVSFLTFSAHVVVPPCSSERRVHRMKGDSAMGSMVSGLADAVLGVVQ